jgi:hypothetical protein
MLMIELLNNQYMSIKKLNLILAFNKYWKRKRRKIIRRPKVKNKLLKKIKM